MRRFPSSSAGDSTGRFLYSAALSGLPARAASSPPIDEGFENGVGDWAADGGTPEHDHRVRSRRLPFRWVFTSDSSGSNFIHAPTPIQPAAEYQFTAFLLI